MSELNLKMKIFFVNLAARSLFRFANQRIAKYFSPLDINLSSVKFLLDSTARISLTWSFQKISFDCLVNFAAIF